MALRQKGLEAALEKAVKDKEECNQKLQESSEALINYKGKDENPLEKKAVQKATDAVAHEQETCKSLITQVFQLYSNLLMEEAMRPWSKILEEQIEVPPRLMYLESSTPKSRRSCDSPLWIVSSSTYSWFSGVTQPRLSAFT